MLSIVEAFIGFFNRIDFILLYVITKVLRAAKSLPHVIDDLHELAGIWQLRNRPGGID